jgi:hypothetical protein
VLDSPSWKRRRIVGQEGLVWLSFFQSLLSIPEELLELLVREISVCHDAGAVQQWTGGELASFWIVDLEYSSLTFSPRNLSEEGRIIWCLRTH